jgi:hypothetical protein
MKIGTDVSIQECRRSGYMVIDFPKGLIKDGVLDKDREVELSISFPEAWHDSGTPMIGTDLSLWSLRENYSWNDLIEFINYSDRREMVASCCDWEHCQPEMDNPNEYDLLHLASDISATFSLANS